jgi:hypothetical protein
MKPAEVSAKPTIVKIGPSAIEKLTGCSPRKGKMFGSPLVRIVTINPPIEMFIPRITIKKDMISLCELSSALLLSQSS